MIMIIFNPDFKINNDIIMIMLLSLHMTTDFLNVHSVVKKEVKCK